MTFLVYVGGKGDFGIWGNGVNVVSGSDDGCWAD